MMELQMLSPQTKYAAYLVFKLTGTHYPEFYGLSCSAKASIKLVKEDSATETEKETKIVYIVAPVDLGNWRRSRNRWRSVPASYVLEGHVSQKRLDGWMELELGEFFIGEEDEGKVEVELLETEHGTSKCGLVVEGIELRAKEQGS